MVRVVEKGVWTDAHVAQRDELVPLDANMVKPLAIIQEVEDVSRSSSTRAIMGFGREVFPEACGVVGEETVSYREAEDGGSGVSGGGA